MLKSVELIATYFITLLLLCWYAAAKPTKSPAAVPTAPPPPTFSTWTSSQQAYWEHVNKTCLSRDCDEHVNLKHLQHMATHINRAINPCENFHEYACSFWKEQHPQQNTMMAVGEQQLTDKYQKIFDFYKANDDKELREDRVMQKLGKYYEVCLESEKTEKASLKEYIKTLRELGYIQFNNQTNWLQTLNDINTFTNSRHFVFLHLERKNSTLFMLYANPHDVDERVKLTPEIYEILKMYTNQSYLQLRLEFKELELDLEKMLNESCLNAIKDESSECDLSEMLSYDQLLKRNSSTNWEYLFSHYPLEREDQIVVDDVNTIEKIKNYLDNSNQRTLYLYSLARFINYLQSLTHNIVDKGSSPQSCLRHMRKHFPILMNYVYEKVYYGPKRSESDKVINGVFAQLKQQFSLILDSNKMQHSYESIQYLQKKLRYLDLNIGNLPKNVQPEFYEEFVSDLNVTSNFYVNHLMALKHFFKRQRLLSSPNKFSSIWYSFNLHMPNFLDNLDSTAYYFSSANFIILPYAYLQLPFYDHRFWPSLLFGDLANTLGHELIHAFDSKFLEYDYGGNLNESMYLTLTNSSRFQRNIQCLSKNPTEFLTERIADISGTHLALRTFIKDPQFLKHNGKLFFLQFAQFFCGSAPQSIFALEDLFHDMDSLRLNYTLAHTPEFAEVFQCPLGSPMNPVEKCQLW